MFRQLVEKILIKNNINPETYNNFTNELENRTYDELLKIFGLKENIIEDIDNQSNIWLARHIYSEFLENIQNKQYIKIDKDLYEINVEDLTIILHTNFKNYNKSTYDYDKKEINVNTQFDIAEIIKIANDQILRSNLIHEIAHSFDFDGDTLSWNYKNFENDKNNYYTQKSEIQANKTAICDFIISFIINNLQQTLNIRDINNTKELQKYIDKMINYCINTKGMLYHEFFSALSKDKKEFKAFYEEIIIDCIKYIQTRFDECQIFSGYNYLCENITNV